MGKCGIFYVKCGTTSTTARQDYPSLHVVNNSSKLLWYLMSEKCFFGFVGLVEHINIVNSSSTVDFNNGFLKKLYILPSKY